MSLRLFHDRGVACVTERRPLAQSCMRLYIPVASGRHPVAGTSGRRIACSHEKSRILESVGVKSTWFFKSVDEFSGDVQARRGAASLALPE